MPGGTHLMLLDLARPLVAGGQLQLALVTVDDRGQRETTRVSVPIIKAGGK